MEYIANPVMKLIKSRQLDDDALLIYQSLNIVDFIHTLELDYQKNNQDNSDKLDELPLMTSDLIFLLDYININCLGTKLGNLNKSFSECLVQYWEHFMNQPIDFWILVKELGNRTDFNQPCGYNKNFIEIALTTPLYNVQKISYIMSHCDSNVLLNSGYTALENILNSEDSLKKLHYTSSIWIETLLARTNYTQLNKDCLDCLDLLWSKRNNLNEFWNYCIYYIAKPLYLSQQNKELLVLDCIFNGKKLGLFSEDELRNMIDNYIGHDFSIPFFHKFDRSSDFANKANILIKLLKNTDNMPDDLKDKIEILESHPKSTTIYYTWTHESQKTCEPVRKFPDPVYQKYFSDNLYFYIFEKAQEALHHSLHLHIDKGIVFNMFSKLRIHNEKVTQSKYF